VDKRERERILGEWGVGIAERAQLVREGTTVRADLEGSPLTGKPLRRRLRNFRAEADTYIASLGGPLPYMQRLRTIEAETERHLEQLAAAYAEHGHDPAAWRRLVESWNFDAVNELIDKHNRWYPVEARLAMDPRSRDFVKVGGRSYRRERLDAAWVLARFPA
jgi:hypothetical protein